MFNLKGRVAVVTGASSGLGKQMAKGFAEAGAIFIASDEASYVTGVILPIDGGYTCV